MCSLWPTWEVRGVGQLAAPRPIGTTSPTPPEKLLCIPVPSGRSHTQQQLNIAATSLSSWHASCAQLRGPRPCPPRLTRTCALQLLRRLQRLVIRTQQPAGAQTPHAHAPAQRRVGRAAGLGLPGGWQAGAGAAGTGAVSLRLLGQLVPAGAALRHCSSHHATSHHTTPPHHTLSTPLMLACRPPPPQTSPRLARPRGSAPPRPPWPVHTGLCPA